LPRGLHDFLYALPGDKVHCFDGTDGKENQLAGSPEFDSGGLFFLWVLVIGLITPFDALSRIGSFGELFRWPLLWEFCLGTLRGGRLGEGRIGGFRLAIAGLFLGYLGIAFLIAMVVQ